MNDFVRHTALMNAYPFLRKVPAALFRKIDQNEIYLPTKSELIKLSELSNLLQKHIVLYKPGYLAGEICLCRVLKAAELTERETQLLIRFEAELMRGSIVVAYQNPVTLKLV